MTQSTSSSNQIRQKQLSSSLLSIDGSSQTLLSTSDPSFSHLQLLSILTMRCMLLCPSRRFGSSHCSTFHASCIRVDEREREIYVLAVWARGWQMAIESNLELKLKGVEKDFVIKSYVCETRWNFISALTQIQKSFWNFYSLSLCSTNAQTTTKTSERNRKSWSRVHGSNFISTITTKGWKG